MQGMFKTTGKREKGRMDACSKNEQKKNDAHRNRTEHATRRKPCKNIKIGLILKKRRWRGGGEEEEQNNKLNFRCWKSWVKHTSIDRQQPYHVLVRIITKHEKKRGWWRSGEESGLEWVNPEVSKKIGKKVMRCVAWTWKIAGFDLKIMISVGIYVCVKILNWNFEKTMNILKFLTEVFKRENKQWTWERERWWFLSLVCLFRNFDFIIVKYQKCESSYFVYGCTQDTFKP